MGPLRTLLFVPGGRLNMIERTRNLQPDGVIFDLEDSVPLGEKEHARAQVRAAIPSFAAGGRGVWARVNSTYTGMAKDDVRAVVTSQVDGILLPKADSAAIVRYAEALLRDQESRAGIEAGSIRIIAIVETAAALLHVEEISRASSRLVALAFGAEDYVTDMGIERTRTGDELQYARHAIAVAARAAGLQALDTVYPFLHDIDALTRETEMARRAGFKGKLLIDPEQIEPVARVFAPSEEEIARARPER